MVWSSHGLEVRAFT